MKTNTATVEGAPIAEAAAPGSKDSRPTTTEIAQEVRRLDKRERLQKLNLQVEPLQYLESTTQAPRESRPIGSALHSEECPCDKSLSLPKYILFGDVIETREGDRPTSVRGVRFMTEEEVSETLADARSLQTGAQIRRLQAQAAKPESDLRRVRSELSNSREVGKSIHEGIAALEVEEKEKEAAVERARKPLEEFFSGKPEAWKEKALAEAARSDRDALPSSPPEKARAHFPPRLDGGEDFVVNRATGELERFR